ncbi:MAG: hypothetical protein Q4G21_02760 [Dermabacter sp.]|nr:hypothetical protein [Dermabacter sp.]
MEIFFDVRRNGLATLLKAFITTLFLASAYSVISFTESTDSAVNSQFGESNNRNLYSITDSVTDPGAFEQKRQDPQSLESIAKFYNFLNASSTLTLLSAFDQPVPILDFAGGMRFDAWRSDNPDAGGFYVDPGTGKPTLDVLSMQMNQNVFDFYGLTISDGSGIAWGAIDYSDSEIPILLGHNYTGIYSVGDTLDGALYSKGVTFRVVGFLSKNSSMFFKNTNNFFLDDYMIIPYPPALQATELDDLGFFGILAFAMLNADIAAPKDLPSEHVLRRVESFSQRAGFDEYAFIDVPQYLTQYSLTRSILIENQALLVSLMAAVTLCTLLALLNISKFIARRRASTMKIRWKLGDSGNSLNWRVLAMTLLDWLLAGCLFVSIYVALPSSGSSAVLGVLFVLVTLALADVLVSLYICSRFRNGVYIA